MTGYAKGLARRFEGRLFTHDGRLYFVLDVDTESGMARVSCRTDVGQQVIEMPIAEVGYHLSFSSNLMLDTLSSDTTATRVVQDGDDWFFMAREGRKGPYHTCEAAHAALHRHILSSQIPVAAG